MQRPLDGLVVLELGQLVAGPFAGSILGYFGAEVIKIEAPSGDPLRAWRHLEDGTSLWWRTLARNKKSVVLDLGNDSARGILKRLLPKVDVVVENFRPGTLEKWQLDPERLLVEFPHLIIARVSGFGQSGPYRERPGFASVCEAYGGLRHLTGHPGQTPVRANLSLGDSLGGLHAVLGILLSLYHRDRKDRPGTGQIIDVALTESVLSMLESVLLEYDRAGEVRQPSGTTITGVVPTGAYRCADDKDVVIGANSEAIFARLCQAMGRSELAEDARFRGNDQRVRHQEILEATIVDWVRALPLADVLERLQAAQVPCAPIYDARHIADDPHFRARELFETVTGEVGAMRLPRYAPLLSKTPGKSLWAGPELGQHTRSVLDEHLQLGTAEVEALAAAGAFGEPAGPA